MRRLPLVCVLLAVWPAAVLADSLWGAGSAPTGSLYGQAGRAFELGDIVTILLVENTSASSTAELDTEKESEKEVQFEGFDRIGIPLGIGDIDEVFGVPLNTNPTFGLDSESDFEGEGETNRTARITGTVSAQVVEVAPNGVLRLEATQTVYVNEEMNQIVLTGLVRPEDVDTRNMVTSTRIANAEIFYTGRGPVTNTNRRGILTELWEFLWPF